MNYRHHFHAGNFADLVKHAILLQLLGRLTAGPGRLMVLDTHAGAGVYDLEGEAARRSGEALQGVVRLMADGSAPQAFEPLKRAVRALNPGKDIKTYPGSPLLTVQALRRGDRYLGCELRPDDHAALADTLKAPGPAEAEALHQDGYALLKAGVAWTGPRLILIDPPFERGDEYAQMVEAVRSAARVPGSTFILWTPLKDLQTFDAFLGGIESIGLNGFAVETRLRSLEDPLRLNGCTLTLLGNAALLDPLQAPARAITDWTARTLGGSDAQARIEQLG